MKRLFHLGISGTANLILGFLVVGLVVTATTGHRLSFSDPPAYCCNDYTCATDVDYPYYVNVYILPVPNTCETRCTDKWYPSIEGSYCNINRLREPGKSHNECDTVGTEWGLQKADYWDGEECETTDGIWVLWATCNGTSVQTC